MRELLCFKAIIYSNARMLFGENKANAVGTGNAIGSFGSGDSGNAAEARMRVAMGLPVTDKKGDS